MTKSPNDTFVRICPGCDMARDCNFLKYSIVCVNSVVCNLLKFVPPSVVQDIGLLDLLLFCFNQAPLELHWPSQFVYNGTLAKQMNKNVDYWPS